MIRSLRATGEDYSRLFAMFRWPALLGALVDVWARFWFAPIPAVRVGLLRIWLFGFVACDVVLRDEVNVQIA